VRRLEENRGEYVCGMCVWKKAMSQTMVEMRRQDMYGVTVEERNSQSGILLNPRIVVQLVGSEGNVGGGGCGHSRTTLHGRG